MPHGITCSKSKLCRKHSVQKTKPLRGRLLSPNTNAVSVKASALSHTHTHAYYLSLSPHSVHLTSLPSSLSLSLHSPLLSLSLSSLSLSPLFLFPPSLLRTDARRRRKRESLSLSVLGGLKRRCATFSVVGRSLKKKEEEGRRDTLSSSIKR